MPVQTIVPGQTLNLRYTPAQLMLLAQAMGGMPPGNVYFVDSGATNAADNPGAGTREQPFATVNWPMSNNNSPLTNNRGDILLVHPRHVETVTAAGGLNLNRARASVIGMGNGAQKPQINFTTVVGADMDVSAAGILMWNFLFTGGLDALTGPIDVNAPDFSLLDCEYRDVTGQCTDCIVADANADRLMIDGLVYRGAVAAGTNAAIALTGMESPTIRNFWIDGNFAVGGIDVRTTALTDLTVRDGYFRTRNNADIFLIDTITGSTGLIGPNIYIRLQQNEANITEAITGATFVVFDNVYVVNGAGEKAMLINWVASTDA